MASGVSEDELIKRAGKILYNEVIKNIAKAQTVLCAVGSGNNGSDALEVAILLRQNGYKVKVFTISEKANEQNSARRDTLKSLGVEFVNTLDGDYALIVDGLFGIGLSPNRPLDEKTASVIEKINSCGAFIISADIPSGLDGYGGTVASTAIKANQTVTFTAIKSGMLLGQGRNYCGKITVGEIGINCDEVGQINAPAPLPKREIVSHKGTYGKVKVIGGSENMVGAPYLAFESAKSALRAGAGLVTLCVPDSEKTAYSSRVVENMLFYLPSKNGKIVFNREKLDEIMENANAIVIGTGMTKSEDTAKCVIYLAQNFDGVLVVDADGINSVCACLGELKNHKCKLIFTPHLIEFYRLLGKNSDDLIEDSKAFAKEYNCTVAVKSATTLITNGDKVYFNLTGTPAMAKGGSGDVLAGLVGAFSCVENPFNATARACYEFGKAGERAVKRLNSEVSVLASDIIIEIDEI